MNCLILGDNTKKTFSIKNVNTDNTVGDLRESIYLKNPQSFTGIDAKDLILWKVNIPDEVNEKTKLLNTKPPSKINIKQDLEGVELSSTTWKLEKYYSQIPTKEHIHVI